MCCASRGRSGWRPGLWGEFRGALSVAAVSAFCRPSAVDLMFTGGSDSSPSSGSSRRVGWLPPGRHRDRRAARSAQVSHDPERPLPGVAGLDGWPRPTHRQSTAVGVAQPSPPRAPGSGTPDCRLPLLEPRHLAGSLLGNALGDPRRWGLDAAAYAAFCALLWPRLRGRDPIATATCWRSSSPCCPPFVPAGVMVILSAVAALVVALGGWGTQRPDRPDRPTSDGPRASWSARAAAALTMWIAVLLACRLLRAEVRRPRAGIRRSPAGAPARITTLAAGRPARRSPRRADPHSAPGGCWSSMPAWGAIAVAIVNPAPARRFIIVGARRGGRVSVLRALGVMA